MDNIPELQVIDPDGTFANPDAYTTLAQLHDSPVLRATGGRFQGENLYKLEVILSERDLRDLARDLSDKSTPAVGVALHMVAGQMVAAVVSKVFPSRPTSWNRGARK